MSLPPSLLSPLVRESLDVLDVCETPDALGGETAALRSISTQIAPPHLLLCLVSLLSNISSADGEVLHLQNPLDPTSTLLHPQASASDCVFRPPRPLCLSSSAPCVSLSQVEVGAAARSRETLSAAVSLLPQTRG